MMMMLTIIVYVYIYICFFWAAGGMGFGVWDLGSGV